MVGFDPHFRREIINTVDSSRTASIYGKPFFVFFEANELEAYRSSEFSDSIFFDPKARIVDAFSDTLLKNQRKKLDSEDHFSSEYHQKLDRVEKRFQPFVDCFESATTLAELRDNTPSLTNKEYDILIGILRSSYREFKFKKYTALTFDDRNTNGGPKRNELFIYRCPKLVLVSVNWLKDQYNTTDELDAYSKFLVDLDK